jgi:hypothetical protein
VSAFAFLFIGSLSLHGLITHIWNDALGTHHRIYFHLSFGLQPVGGFGLSPINPETHKKYRQLLLYQNQAIPIRQRCQSALCQFFDGICIFRRENKHRKGSA